MYATEVISIAVQELQIGQVINDALYFFVWIDRSEDDFAKSELKFLPATLESGCTLKCWGNMIMFGLLGLIPLEEERQMVALRSIDYKKPYWRTCTSV